ncbi:putative non-specific lipid-transfer protein 14 [Magnolia sinica]|uniref:putative non-specific lipid-transfer protein 14 n=1 Tax=Magnolia sinica TaxID=86752 RepID=UPI00265A069A|nr:putative non-specific lipid-transfer protein 14 [Magnolia sinica]
MGSKGFVICALMVLMCTRWVKGNVDCSTVSSLISNCSNFILYGIPEPMVGSPCCNAVVSLNSIADSPDDRRSVCRCLMGLITTYNPNSTAIATLPGFCGISLGFTIDPNTDCNSIP